MKEKTQNFAQLRSYLLYFRQIGDIHFNVYKAQNFSALNKYEKHIAFIEMISALEIASPVKVDEENKTSKQELVLGINKSTIDESILKTEGIIEAFNAAANSKNSGKLAKRYWTKITADIEKLYPNFDHFFKVAEEKYKTIDGLVKNNKNNYQDAEELKFLLEIQQQARFKIIEINRLKYELEAKKINDSQQQIHDRQKQISKELIVLKLDITSLQEKNADPEETVDEELKSKNDSLRKNYDISYQEVENRAASKSVTAIKSQILELQKQQATRQSKKVETAAEISLIDTQIKFLETEKKSSVRAYDLLSEEKRRVTENYLKIYCNYRQNWINDDDKSNLPTNCPALNFKKESSFVLDGINFGDIPITITELASADVTSLNKIIGMTRDQANALGKEKQSTVLGVEDKDQPLIKAGDLISQVQDINYNCNVPADSSLGYLLWLENGQSWEKKHKPKSEETPSRRRTLSGLVKFRFRANTEIDPDTSFALDFEDAENLHFEDAPTRDTDEEDNQEGLPPAVTPSNNKGLRSLFRRNKSSTTTQTPSFDTEAEPDGLDSTTVISGFSPLSPQTIKKAAKTIPKTTMQKHPELDKAQHIRLKPQPSQEQGLYEEY